MEMNIMEFIKPELLLLVPVLYFIGMALKKFANLDKWIPLLLGAVGVALSFVYVMATSDAGNMWMAAFVAITQGVLCAGCSVYVNQIIKQAGK